MEQKRFEQLKDQTKMMAKRTGACKEGFKHLVSSNNLGEFSSVIHKYWADIIQMLKKDHYQFLYDAYPIYKDAFNRCGIWFNEPSNTGRVILTEGEYNISGDALIWAYGKTKIKMFAQVRCIATDEVLVIAHNTCQVQLLDKARCSAYDMSVINAAGDSIVHAFGSSTILAGERAVIYAHGWRGIKAAGQSQVFAPTKYKINTFGQASLTIKRISEL